MATQATTDRKSGQQPTRVRYWVIFYAVTLAIVTYIDRVCIGKAAPLISQDLKFDTVKMGAVFSAFGIAYALFEIPGGFLGDWMGPRRVLMRIVMWWSFFTAATGWAWSFTSMLVTRFLFGAGEAGCFPNLTKAFTTWLPQEERVRAQGIMWLSARWGGAFTPLLVVAVFSVVTWRTAFTIFGGIGVVWAVFFYRWFRDHPKDNPALNEAELELLRGNETAAQSHANIPWARFWSSKQVWLLCAQYFFLSYGWYFYITWMPTYLKQARGVEFGKSAVLEILPLFLGGLGSLFSGYVAGPLTRMTGSVRKTRRILGCIGFAGASGMLILSVQLKDPFAAMVAMGFASFSNDLVMPGAWGGCMDVGGRFAGTLSGAMNMSGNIAGALAPSVIGVILANTNNDWDLTFYVSAAVYLLGVPCWLVLDSVTPLEQH